ncbi:Ribonuclease/ribotoxin [Phialemonium atrogriseum]|uniref:ribonuclease T1 n=1 Tax=Phialemonium atrogriseum TaxID=1093897 RepID=A0AAJ0BQQ8_9PEZI|nr:Ribonuclease/ribotoxin [Phialemonium atrogriseum]KAK1762725.1 Ribonuclease/ribotoxin [Phialemonium atrogriseum]
MVSFRILPAIVLGLLTVTASGAVIPLEERASCVYTCGSVCYWQSDIDDALAKGYSLHQSGATVDDYPHQYNDYEGFDFPTSAPWYEFPILSSYKVFTSGSPGADRVVFDSKGKFDALITHNGATGNNFVACKKG